VLLSPTPFNTNPSTTPLCGVAAISDAMKSTAQATWKAGQLVTIAWHLIASDGGGNLYGAFDPLGGTDFTVPAWTTVFTTSGSNKFYNHTFSVPSSLSCSQSPTGLCSFRVYTSSNWNSCTMVNVCEDCVAPPPPPLVCSPVNTKLTFCPSNISDAMISEGYVASDIDADLRLTLVNNLNNTNVFQNGKSLACQQSYTTLLCSLSLTSCNPLTVQVLQNSRACRAQCKETMSECEVAPAHVSLYDCDTLPLCPGEVDDAGNDHSSGMSGGGKAALSIFFIGIVGAACVAGYFYHKQGHLMGYTFDKNTKKIVKVPANPHNFTAYEEKMYM